MARPGNRSETSGGSDWLITGEPGEDIRRFAHFCCTCQEMYVMCSCEGARRSFSEAVRELAQAQVDLDGRWSRRRLSRQGRLTDQ